MFSFTFKCFSSRHQHQTIISVLQRLRNQHLREGGVSYANSNSAKTIGSPVTGTRGIMPSSPAQLSNAAPHVQVQHDAAKILNKTERPQELMTDLLPSSPMYCVEVGKLLSIGAHFGCSSTTPRIADALLWVAQYGETSLRTLRQIMSIVTPLINLSDGRTAGCEVFWSHLMAPLEKAVCAVWSTSTTSSNYSEHLQARAGILSVFQMVTKLFSVDEDSGGGSAVAMVKVVSCDPVQWERLVRLMSSCTKALVVIASAGKQTTDPVLELQECTAALTALRALESGAPETGCSRSSLDELYTRWLQLLDVSMLNGSSQQSARKTAIVIQLTQLALSVPCHTKSHRLLQHALQLIPSAISSSAIKDICALTQSVNRLRQKFGYAVTPSVIQRVMEAARPKIILLSEGTHAGQFRHIESSILMGNLSRWEEVAGQDSGPGPDTDAAAEGMVVSNDLLDLLCSRFVIHMDLVWMNHLVPFLQGLCRLEEAHRRRRRQRDRDTFILLSELRLEDFLHQCMKRTIALSRMSKCTPVEAASALRAFVELGANAEAVFLAVKDILVGPLVRGLHPLGGMKEEEEEADATTTLTAVVKEEAEKGMPEKFTTERLVASEVELKSAPMAPSSYIPVVKAVDVFRRRFHPLTDEGKQTVEMAQKVLDELHRLAPGYVRQANSPAELISLFATIARVPSSKGAEDQGDGTSPGTTTANTVLAASPDGSAAEDVPSVAAPNSEAATAFLERVAALSAQCGIPELATFSLGVSQLADHPQAHTTMASIMRQLEAHQEQQGTVVPLLELKKIMDATSKMGYTDAAAWLSKAMLPSLHAWGGGRSSAEMPAASDDLFAHLQDFAHFTRSAVRVVTVLALSPSDARAIYHVVLGQASVHLKAIGNLELQGPNGQRMLSELTFLSFNLSRYYEVVTKMNENEMPMSLALEELEPTSADPPDLTEESSELASAVDSDLHSCTRMLWSEIGDLAERLLSGSTHDESGEELRKKIEPKKMVMLIQSFEKCEVAHTPLMYTLLHELRQVAPLLDPLELSLVMNAALRQGVWNARLMQQLASEVERKVQYSPLRQCHSILFALERSHFLSPNTYLDVSHSTAASSSSMTGVVSRPSPLETLAKAALKRMRDLASTRAQVHHLLLKETFLDVINSVRVLAFFHSSPQPMLDTYFMVAAKRFITFCIRVRQKKNGVVLSAAEIKTVSQAGLHLLQCVHKVRQARHRRVASVAIQRALLMVEENDQRTASIAAGAGDVLMFWTCLSAREVAELLVTLQIHQLFYRPQRSSRGHRRRITLLYTRLIQAYLRKLRDLTDNPRQLHHALLPLFSPGGVMGLTPCALRREDLLSLFESLPESTRTSGAVSTLVASAILCRMTFPPPRSIQSESDCRELDLLKSFLHIRVDQQGNLHPSDAIVLLRSSTVVKSGASILSLESISSVLLTASLSLSNAVEVLIVMARRRHLMGGLELDLEAVAVKMMRLVSPICTRQDPSGYRTLVQIYRLLTEDDGILLRAFMEEEPVNSPMRVTCAELVLQAISAVAKAYYNPLSPTHGSLAAEPIRRVCQSVKRSLAVAETVSPAPSPSGPNAIGEEESKRDGELRSRILEICNSLF